MQNLNKTLENLREFYQGESFDINDCRPTPEAQFNSWFQNAVDAKCDEPNAFILSTVTSEHKPRARVVLLKGIQDGQFVFFTNYDSAKGDELKLNDQAAMTFLWLPLQRQIRIEGKVTKIAASASEDYFQKRPRGSQLGAIASPQSQKIASKEELEKLFQEVTSRFENSEVLPRPSHWGGYGISPDYFEFWQGRPNRMHDRIAYESSESGWNLSRLAP
jgi:pyridoxamine 5'-phosphate oxidase